MAQAEDLVNAFWLIKLMQALPAFLIALLIPWGARVPSKKGMQASSISIVLQAAQEQELGPLYSHLLVPVGGEKTGRGGVGNTPSVCTQESVLVLAFPEEAQLSGCSFQNVIEQVGAFLA